LARPNGEAFIHPLGPLADHRLKATFAKLETGSEIPWSLKDESFDPLGRGIPCIAKGEKAGWFTFDALCGAPRSYIDYLNLTANFEAVIVSNLTAKAFEWPSVTQRFVWLIDVLYDKGVKLALSSQSPIAEMLEAAAGVPDLNRTQSRLTEMAAWLTPMCSHNDETPEE